MQKNDLRTLSIAHQEAVRFKVLKDLDNGMRKKDVICKYGISNAVIYKWLNLRGSKKDDGYKQEKRGRPSQIRLTDNQERQAIRLIIDFCPDEVNLPMQLWTRSAIGDLLRVKFNIEVSTWTINRYLRSWGLTTPATICKSKGMKSPEVKSWLKKEYRVIKEIGIKKSVEIYWGGEKEMKSDNLAGITSPLVGKARVRFQSNKRNRLYMLYAVSNRDKLHFMFLKKEATKDDVENFMTRLEKSCQRKIYLLVEHDLTHTEWSVLGWNRKKDSNIEMILLPSYRLFPYYNRYS